MKIMCYKISPFFDKLIQRKGEKDITG